MFNLESVKQCGKKNAMIPEKQVKMRIEYSSRRLWNGRIDVVEQRKDKNGPGINIEEKKKKFLRNTGEDPRKIGETKKDLV